MSRVVARVLLVLSVLAASLSLGIGPAAADPPDSTAVQIVNNNSHLCLDIAASRTDSGAPAQQWECGGTAAQKWTLVPLSYGTYRIQNANSHLCLEIGGWRTDNEATANQGDCHTGTDQQWRLTSRGTGLVDLRNVNSSKCLLSRGSTHGTAGLQYDCDPAYGDQVWALGYGGPKATAPASGEVAHYAFDETTGTTARNALPGGADATLVGGAAWDTEKSADSPQSLGARSVALNGNGSSVTAPVALAADQSFTVSTWVKVNQLGHVRTILSQDGARVSSFYLKVLPDGRQQFILPRTDSETTAWDVVYGPAVTLNTWTHLTGVYDASAKQIRLYVNGTRVATSGRAAPLKGSGGLQIGRGWWSGHTADYLDGKVDEVRAWQSALPDADIAALMGGAGPFLLAGQPQIREDTCRLGFVAHVGGPAMKATAQAGLASTSPAELHRLASPDTMPGYQQDKDALWAKFQAMNDRASAWEVPLAGLTVPFVTDAAFQHAPAIGDAIAGFYAKQWWEQWDHFFVPLAPQASQAAQDTVKQMYVAQYPDVKRADYATDAEYRAASDRTDYARSMWYVFGGTTGVRNADDVRLFLQQGGFPTRAPAPGTVEFRQDVEALKLRFASCESGNPIALNGALDLEASTAGAEWAAELAAQAGPRATILAAEAQASTDLKAAAEAMVEAVGQSWIASQLTNWQAYWLARPTNEIGYPRKASFDTAATAIAHAKSETAVQLGIATQAASSAQVQAAKVAGAQDLAGQIAQLNGTPYGRGLAYAQQSAQVTKASAAAAQAAANATSTATNATQASVADSGALFALAQTQGHALQAEFQRAAAKEAADQAHAAAVAAKAQADQAAQAATRAKADRTAAANAEAAAKVSAAKAAAQRQVAQTEQARAAAARATADTQRALAATAEAAAQAQQAKAATAAAAAQAAAATAASNRVDAEAAESRAATARSAAMTAADNGDAVEGRAEAMEAASAAAAGTASADAARQAATAARSAATTANTAANAARTDATAAGNAAVAARTAATQATGAAERAHAASNSAAADAADTHAQALTAHAAAADAIVASGLASANVTAAQALADSAKADAAKAKTDSGAAKFQAEQAQWDAARTAGYAYAAGRSAMAARDSASAVIAPANDAIALGSPFRQADVSAGLAVLVGQSSKTIAEQQDAVAQAQAAQAGKAAVDAKALADKATGDAKAAAQSAAYAAGEATGAVQSVSAARVSAVAAAVDAAAAAQSDANTAALEAQAKQDAATAAASAVAASGDASAARDAATAAERDAAAARTAASVAAADAATARTAATSAERDATAAEAAAASAQVSAQQAQDAAALAEAKARDQITVDQQTRPGPTGIGGVLTDYRLEDTITADAWTCNFTGTVGDPNAACRIPVVHHLKSTFVYRLLNCGTPDLATMTVDCTRTYLDTKVTTIDRPDTVVLFTAKDKFEEVVENLKDMTYRTFTHCANSVVNGQASADCGWAAVMITPPGRLAKVVEVVRGVGTALKSGIGIDRAIAAARMVEMAPETMAILERAAANQGLIDELAANGVNFSAADVIGVARNAEGKIVFLETGSSNGGLVHIMEEHGTDFVAKGLSAEQIPDFVLKAATEGTIIGYQGKGTGRPIFQVLYNGKTWTVAVSVGSNGFIVGANLTGSPQ
ncbi:hypothetical protein Lfu02_39480 [Longispora fulva]|uniref:Uncharacterized protein n=1 Tax=Longispora fulva TaxID=619741 RepID=A0A8J7GQT1_9ACTN|nr:RICIN domain-containing protein [Longispora fulva]MBG6136408.1 hypothetical protein [Longispora fulva]GIG59576.1 hypothetical protein Lfu02_39480 [Longispora fulva]